MFKKLFTFIAAFFIFVAINFSFFLPEIDSWNVPERAFYFSLAGKEQEGKVVGIEPCENSQLEGR